MKALLIGFSVGFLLTTAAVAQQEKSSSGSYSLFKPVPRDKMRDMETDRPDATECPITVDAGHFQFETDLFKHVYNSSGGSKITTSAFNAMNLKLGLTGSTDLQVGTDSYDRVSDISGNAHSSFSDFTVRVKQNFFGNGSGNVAMGMIPYMVLPTNDPDEGRETGIILPVSFSLKNDFSISTQVAVARAQLFAKSYETTFMNSVSLGKGFGEKLSAFAEGFYTYGSVGKAFRFTFDSGLVYAISPNVAVDAGFGLGARKDTDRAYYTGFSFRY